VITRQVTTVVNGTAQSTSQNYRMQYYAKIHSVQLIDHFFRFRKHVTVEDKRTVRGIPTRRSETRAEINQRIAGQFLFAKSFCDPENRIGSAERPVRLLITERPEWRHLWRASQPRVFSHNLMRLASSDNKHVER